MRTTVEIPDALARRAKYLALESGTTLKALITRGLQREVDGGGKVEVDGDKLVEQARQFRASLGFKADPKDVDAFKREGRA